LKEGNDLFRPGMLCCGRLWFEFHGTLIVIIIQRICLQGWIIAPVKIRPFVWLNLLMTLIWCRLNIYGLFFKWWVPIERLNAFLMTMLLVFWSSVWSIERTIVENFHLNCLKKQPVSLLVRHTGPWCTTKVFMHQLHVLFCEFCTLHVWGIARLAEFIVNHSYQD
jgi:hypothetical protein